MFRAILFVITGLALSAEVWAQSSNVPSLTTRAQPFEISTGTVIQLVMGTKDPGQGGPTSGMVISDVYDHYNHVAIPKGSKLIGQVGQRVNEREEIRWNGLQIAGYNGLTIRLEPPLLGTMPNGSSGVLAGFEPGSTAAAIVPLGSKFTVPH